TVRDEPVTNVAIVDLLPGGFEVVGSSLQPGVSTISGVDYVDVREDRAVFYATVSSTALELNYQIKSSNRGDFTVPPVLAESMYERNVKGRGVGGKISVTEYVGGFAGMKTDVIGNAVRGLSTSEGLRRVRGV